MKTTKTPTALDPWLSVPDTFSAIMDGADDMDLAIYEVRELTRLAREQCNIVKGSDSIATLIRSALRYVDDMEKNNQRLQETVREHASKLKAAGTPQIGGAA
jgi:hypothetical protein